MKSTLRFSSRTLGLGISFVLLLNVAQSQAARIDVYSGQELQQAIQAAVAGDEIVLQPGGYESEATSTLSGFANAHYFGSANGTAQKPCAATAAPIVKYCAVQLQVKKSVCISLAIIGL